MIGQTELPVNFFNHDAQAGGFYPDAHVGIDVSSFGEGGNILIEGIRGTGKTHLLKKIENEYFSSFAKKKILPIYVSIAQISEYAKRNPDDFRIHLYTHIVKRISETLITYKDFIKEREGIFQNAIKNICKLFDIQYSDKLDKNLDNLDRVAGELRFELEYSLSSSKIIQEDSSSCTDKVSGSSAIALSKDIGSTSSISGETAKTVQTKDGKEYVFLAKQLAEKNSERFIVEYFRQTQLILDLKSL